MGNTISLYYSKDGKDNIAMSNQGTDVFLDMLIDCALSDEMSESQLNILEFFEEKKYINGHSPGTVSFDIEEMPWNKPSFIDDKSWLQKLIQKAKDPASWKKLKYVPEPEIVFPWLDQFSEMIERLNINDDSKKLNISDNNSKLFFKKGLGWKACRDEERNIYTAERSWRGFYELCEIDKETYDILGTDVMKDKDPDKLIREGRQLVESDDDYYTMPYVTIKDENYFEIAPWADAHRRVLLDRKFPYGFSIDSYISRALDEMKKSNPEASKEMLKYAYDIELIDDKNEFVRYLKSDNDKTNKEIMALDGKAFIKCIIEDNKSFIENVE